MLLLLHKTCKFKSSHHVKLNFARAIIHVFKSGEKNLVNTYRAMLLLCNTSKVLEKLVCGKIINFVSKSISSV